MQAHTYLIFNGDCREAFETYARILGGRIETITTFAGTPAEGYVPPHWKDKILHAVLRFGDTTLFGSDAGSPNYEKPQGFGVALVLDDPAEAERIFNALADGGTITMAFSQTFWAHRFGMATDRFGIPWMVNCEKAG